MVAGAGFVGRARVVAELTRAVDRVRSGSGEAIAITGEPGIGKTAVLAELRRIADARAVRVHWGTCRQGDAAPPYWPWIEAFAGDPEGSSVGAALTGDGAATGAPTSGDRHALFGTVRVHLHAAASAAPRLIVLDDVHWADLGSLALLRFLAADLHLAPLLLVVAYRDLEVEADPARAALLGSGSLHAQHLHLDGMPASEIAELTAATTGEAPDPRILAGLERRTGGNPLFVRELVRDAWLQGSLDELGGEHDRPSRVPVGVRDVLLRRIETLEPAAREILAVAALDGEAFRPAVVAAVAEESSAAVRGAIAAAARARLVLDPDAGTPRFAHALVRDVLRDALPADRAGSLHARYAGEVAADPATSAAEVAGHLVRARGHVPPGRVATGCRLAGDEAADRLAWEEAARWFGDALASLEEDRGAPVGERIELLLRRGRALVRAGDLDGAREDFGTAANRSIAEGDAERLAEAALGFGDASPVWGTDATLIDLLDAAHVALADGSPALRARVVARLAQARYFVADAATIDALGRDAVALARSAEDDVALADALLARRVLWGPDDLPGRATLAQELVAVASRRRDADLEARARAWRIVDLIESGDLPGARAEIARHAELARRLGQPGHERDAAMWRATMAMLEGRFEDAERAAATARALGERMHDPGTDAIFAVQQVMLLAELGDPDRAEEALGLARDAVDRYPEIAAWRALHAFALARFGEHEAARVVLDRLVAEGMTEHRRDAVFLVTAAHAADAAAIVGHEPAAQALLPALSGMLDRWITIDRALACKGSTERLVGLLRGVVGDLDAAVEHLERARTRHTRAGAEAFAARTCVELADLLRRRGRSEDERGPDVDAPNALLLQGAVWEIRFGDAVIRLPDGKGLRDLARLLAKPELEIHVLDLAGHPGQPTQGGLEMLDATAVSSYRARIEELRADLAEAEAFSDAGRVERARTELETLVERLGAAYGMGGRRRTTSDDAERARKAVTWRIRAAIDRIESAHPGLARHLRTAIKTGVFCSYRPERPTVWAVDPPA